MVSICGVIGFTSSKVTIQDLDVLRKAMIESKIRGKHASGIAWFDGKSIRSDVRPVPIDILVNSIDLKRMIRDDGGMSIIAHARYSTSNIMYNQPIIGSSIALVHNGVITQSDPDTWKYVYGYRCGGKNDSELLLRCIESGDDPYKVFPHSSFSALILRDDGNVVPMRNGLRPLWYGLTQNGVIYASTYDILKRAGASDIIQQTYTCKCIDLQRRSTKHGNSGR